ncbi:MAG: hypothetical protein ACLS6W_08835 [Ruminococcus sp.]
MATACFAWHKHSVSGALAGRMQPALLRVDFPDRSVQSAACPSLPRTLPARLLLLFHDAIYIVALFVLRPPHEGHLFGVALYPVGISILALQSISYVHLIFRRAILPERHRSSFAFYFCFYPKLLFGPYCSVSTFHRIQPASRCQVEQVGNGLHQLVCGLAKAVLLSGQFYLIIQQMQAASKEHNTLFFSWLYQLLFFLYVYFQITGYTDMAKGIAACYGYALPKSSRLRSGTSSFLSFSRTGIEPFCGGFPVRFLLQNKQRHLFGCKCCSPIVFWAGFVGER